MTIAPVDQPNGTIPSPLITYITLLPVQRKTDRIARKNILINNFFADTELLRNNGSRIRLQPLLDRPKTPFNLRDHSPIPIPFPNTRHLLKPIIEMAAKK